MSKFENKNGGCKCGKMQNIKICIGFFICIINIIYFAKYEGEVDIYKLIATY